MCVDYSVHGKPTIYVNNALTYFNVTGKMTIKNLIFSGINGLVSPSSTTALDLSVLPQLYCYVPHEPNGVNDPSVESALSYKNTLIQSFAEVD